MGKRLTTRNPFAKLHRENHGGEHSNGNYQHVTPIKRVSTLKKTHNPRIFKVKGA